MVTKVVILNWNGRAHLETFLPSVVANTPSDVDIVVVDNGSNDDSCSFIEQNYNSITLMKFDENYGFTGGYNRALMQIEADCFVLLNSDVQTPSGWLKPLTDKLSSDENIFAVAPKLLSYNDKDKFEYAGASGGFIDALGYPFCRGRILSTIECDIGQYDDSCDVFWASGACMVVRARLFKELGGFDAKFFAHMEEIDLCWRAQKCGYRVAVEPQSAVYHLGGGTLPNNSERKIYLNFRNNLAMLYKNLSQGRLYPVLFVRMLLDGASAMVYLLMFNWGFFAAVFRAHRDFYRWLPELTVQRKEILQTAIVEPKTIYRGSIIFRYLVACKVFGRLM